MQGRIKGLLISDFNIEILKGFLSNLPESPTCEITLAPFGQTSNILNNSSDILWSSSWDFVVVWTQPQAVIPAFGRVLEFEEVSEEIIKAQCDAFVTGVQNVTRKSTYVFVASWALPDFFRGLGLIDLRHKNGWGYILTKWHAYVMERLAQIPNVFMLSLDRWLRIVGENACDPRLWYMGKIPYDTKVFRLAALDIKAALRACAGQARKIIIVDLDNTLWGGEVGDDGWENLRLGGHDAIGEAYVDFQRALKSYKNRGVVLAIVSKNDEKTALNVFEQHPEMILKKSDFVTWRINWKDKVLNIIDILKELNLSTEAAVFFDDNVGERHRVHGALPAVLVPDMPSNCMLFPKTLLSLDCFDSTFIGGEDRDRSLLYQQEKVRQEMLNNFQSMDEWLSSLGMALFVEPLSIANLPRAVQLLNKTNQMNLATRRLSDTEFESWSKQANCYVWVFRLKDSLGDSGIIGIASMQVVNHVAHLVDFILSCRVMGRTIEQCMLHVIAQKAKNVNAKAINVQYKATARNKPCLDFFIERSNFQKDKNEVFIWDTTRIYPLPDYVKLVDSQARSNA